MYFTLASWLKYSSELTLFNVNDVFFGQKDPTKKAKKARRFRSASKRWLCNDSSLPTHASCIVLIANNELLLSNILITMHIFTLRHVCRSFEQATMMQHLRGHPRLVRMCFHHRWRQFVCINEIFAMQFVLALFVVVWQLFDGSRTQNCSYWRLCLFNEKKMKSHSITLAVNCYFASPSLAWLNR